MPLNGLLHCWWTPGVGAQLLSRAASGQVGSWKGKDSLDCEHCFLVDHWSWDVNMLETWVGWGDESG